MTISLQKSDVCSFAAIDLKSQRRLQILDYLGCEFTGHEPRVRRLSVEEVGRRLAKALDLDQGRAADFVKQAT